MKKSVGILTKDFKLYHDLVKSLRSKGIPFISLTFEETPPPTVGVVITSPPEASRIRFRPIVVCESVDEAVSRASQLLRGKERFDEIVVGIDPGPKPGIAVVGDGDVVDSRILPSPESVVDLIRSLRSSFESDHMKVKVGHGDVTNRNRIINALSEEGFHIEIVDERGTTKRSKGLDVDAAVDIAFTRGYLAKDRYEIEPTEGEVREIQRRSRIESGGELTISRSLAREVSAGRISLTEAIEMQKGVKPKRLKSDHNR